MPRVCELPTGGPLDLGGTLGPLVLGPGDPTARLAPREAVRATRTPEGPAALHAELVGRERVRVRAWGEGAQWALARAGDLLGLAAVPPALEGAPAPLRALARRAAGVRLARTHRIVELLVPIVLEQLVSGKEAARAFRNLVLACSVPAPGPFRGLHLPLDPSQLRALPPAAFPALGALARQGRTLREIGWSARRLEEADGLPAADAERRLRALPGIGAWSAASAGLRGMGHADAVPIGDHNLPSAVAYNLAGEERADDARMLELLESYQGHRGWVIRWIHAAGRTPPRRGPRHPLRRLAPEGAGLVRRALAAPERGGKPGGTC